MSASPANAKEGSRTPALLNGTPAFAEPVYITRALVPDSEVFDRHIRSIFEARWFTNHGAMVKELEATLRAHLRVGFLAAFCNGTTAIQAALRSLNLRGEVVTTPFTFPATIHAIHWCGLTPVFADIDAETYNLDPEAAEAVMTENTSALLPVHCFGRPCDVLAFEALASRREVGLVYDAAHSFGVQHKGRPIGLWGDLSILSFHATKVFHTAEGGAVVGPDPGDYAEFAMLRNFAIRNEDEVMGTGVNGKLSEVHAAIGLAVLDRATQEFKRRGELAARYRERLREIEGIVVREPAAETELNNAYFPVEIDEAAFGLSRDALHGALRTENIFARKYFHPLCSDNEAYRGHPSAEPARLPNAHRLAARILCLPVYGDLGLANIDLIAERLGAIHEHAPRLRKVLATG